MRKEVYTFGKSEMIRVNKTEAHKYFDRGGMIYLAPCKANLYSPWIKPILIQKDFSDLYGNSFDELVNNFEYYNCCSEVGKYTKFFIINFITD